MRLGYFPFYTRRPRRLDFNKHLLGAVFLEAEYSDVLKDLPSRLAAVKLQGTNA